MTAEEISTGTDQLMASMDEGVLTITLNRPEARNALTFELLDAFAEQLAYAESSSDVRCVTTTQRTSELDSAYASCSANASSNSKVNALRASGRFRVIVSTPSSIEASN